MIVKIIKKSTNRLLLLKKQQKIVNKNKLIKKKKKLPTEGKGRGNSDSKIKYIKIPN